MNKALKYSYCDSKISYDLLLNSQLNKLYRNTIIEIELSIAFNDSILKRIV